MKRERKKLLVISVLIYLIAILFYEVYLFFLIFTGLLILTKNLKKPVSTAVKIKRMLLEFSPYFLVACLYLTAYMIFRMYHPSNYEGTLVHFSGITIKNVLNVLYKLSISAFPISIYSESRPFFYERADMITGYSAVLGKLLITAKVEWLAKGILVALTSFILLFYLQKLEKRTLLKGLFTGVLLIFVPHLLLAVTKKYIFYASSGMIGYVTTYYSFFGVYLVLVILLALLMNFTGKILLRNIIAGLVALTLFTGSVITDFSNHMYASDLRRANVPLKAVGELINTDHFREIPEWSRVYMPDMYDNAKQSVTAGNLYEQYYNWSQFIYEKSKRYWECSRTEQEFRASIIDSINGLYFVNSGQEPKAEAMFIAIGRIDRKILADSVLKEFYSDSTIFLYYSQYKQFTVSFRCGDTDQKMVPLQINQIRDTVSSRGGNVSITVYNTKKNNAATIFKIKAKNIDLKSFRVSDITEPEDKIFYIQQ